MGSKAIITLKLQCEVEVVSNTPDLYQLTDGSGDAGFVMQLAEALSQTEVTAAAAAGWLKNRSFKIGNVNYMDYNVEAQ